MLLYVFGAVSVLAVLALVLFIPALLPWSLILAFGAWLFLVVSSVFFLFIVSLFCIGKPLSSMEGPFLRSLAYHTMDCILTLFGFRIKGEGMEKIPSEPCVIVCNHLSRFDPMVKFVLMKGRKLSFVSKIENMQIPIAGPIIQQIGFVPLDRENSLRALRSIHAAAKLVSEKGYTVGIYPEGTRSRTGELLPFKPGAFVLAKRAGCPLVIASIHGTDRYKGRAPFLKTKVQAEVLEVISSDRVKEMSAEELSEACRTRIEEGLKDKKISA